MGALSTCISIAHMMASLTCRLILLFSLRGAARSTPAGPIRGLNRNLSREQVVSGRSEGIEVCKDPEVGMLAVLLKRRIARSEHRRHLAGLTSGKFPGCPKSTSTARLSAVTMIFSGLMSRWITFS